MSDTTPSSAPETLLWPDLSSHGVSLGIVPHEGGGASLIFVDQASKHGHIAKNMGFQKTRWTGLWTRSDIRVEASSFRAAFPQVNVVRRTFESIKESALESIRLIVEASRQPLLPGFEPVGDVDGSKEPVARVSPLSPRGKDKATSDDEGLMVDISPLASSSRSMGVNLAGQEVFESPDRARFVRFDKETDAGVVSQVEKETARLTADDATAAKFLRAGTDGALALCADAFVKMMADGHIARVDELHRFFRSVTDREFTQDDPDLNRVIAAIDRSRVRKLAQLVVSPDLDAFHAALRLHEAAQYYTAVKSQRMTPLPVSVVLQHIASAMPENSSVRINNAENGEFSSFTEGVSKFNESAAGTASDLLLAAYEGTLLEKSVQAFGTSVSRNDHANVLQSLQTMSPTGMGIFVIEGDTVPGRIGPSSRRFMDALANLHEISGIVDIDGSLMGVPGAPPSRMIVVGPRRDVPGHGGLPPALPYVTDYLSLWGWSANITQAIRKPGSVSYTDRGGVSKETVIGENAFQAPYIPTSLLSDPTLMVPRNLASPLRRAMIEINKEIPHIDPWLENQLQFAPGEMKAAISSEQADAVVMGLRRMDEGRGFMIADQTGIGKGRIIAQLARAARVRGEPVIFLTEKAELFTDLWRDIEDTNSEGFFQRIMILNDNEKIISTKTGEVVASSAPRGDVDRVMRSMKMPPDVDIVFATYSQFNRDPVKAIKNHSDINLDAISTSTLSASAKKMIDWARRRREAQNKKPVKVVVVESVNVFANQELIDKMPLAAVKSLWIGRATTGALLVMDESHNASGETSQTNMNFDRAVQGAKNVVYSSATFARGESNMRIYRRLFPKSVDVEALHQTLKKGGEALQEALSSMLAEDGAMVRREHDLSMLKFIPKIDLKRQVVNEKYTDQLAEILAAMTYLTRETRQLTDALSEKIRAPLEALHKANLAAGRLSNASREAIDAVGIVKRGSIGNSLYTIMRAFLAVLKTDLATEEAVKAMREGRKPVLVIDHTMEAEMNRRLDEAREKGETIEDDGEIVMKVPGFQAILRDRLEGLLHVSLDGQELEIKKEPQFAAVIRQIENLIKDFPDFSTSPIDSIRQGIAKAGFGVAELSGRKRRVEYLENGMCRVVNISPKERRAAKDRFNNGDAEAIILTRAGNAGISLHDSYRFTNRGQRELIEVEVPEDVIARVQFMGRVNRNGQVSYPIIKTLSSGIPAENRQLALQNNKLRRMSANITANRDNSAITREVADVINTVGNEVAYRLIEIDPILAEKLDIDLIDRVKVNSDGEETIRKLTGEKYVSDLMNRLVVLPVAQQKDIIEEMTVEFAALVEELDSAGTNPLCAKFYDINAKRVDERVLELALTTAVEGERQSTFDKPVTISTIEYTDYHEPMSSKDLVRHMKQGKLDQAELVSKKFDGCEDYVQWRNENPKSEFADYAINVLVDSKLDILTKYKASHATVSAALADSENNMVKQMDKKIDTLVTMLATVKIGSTITWVGRENKGESLGVVVGLRIPDPGALHYAGRYQVKIALAGEKLLVTKSVNSLISEPWFQVKSTDFDTGILKEFDSRKIGSYEVSRPVLDGNLFRAAEMSIQTDMGTQAYYSDENGMSNRAVVLPTYCKAKDFELLPLRVHEKELAKEFFLNVLEGQLYSSAAAGRDDNDRRVQRKGMAVEKGTLETFISVPGNTQWIEWLRSHPELMKVTGAFGGSRDMLFAVVPNAMLPALIDELYGTGMTLYAHSDAVAHLGKDVHSNPRQWFAEKFGGDAPVQTRTALHIVKDPFAALDNTPRAQMLKAA